MLVLAGIAVIVAGFLLRLNPLPVIAASALVTGLAAGLDPLAVLDRFGHAFAQTRYVTAIYLVLPAIGLLEAHGLQDRARAVVAGFARLTAGRLLVAYLLLRQLSAAIGLISVAGPAQTVRPLLAPMAAAAARAQGLAEADEAGHERVRAMAAATDNVGMFFGEDIFLAIGSILLMKGLLDTMGLPLDPLALSFWAMPTALAAFAIHGGRLLLLDRRIGRRR